MKNNIWNIRGIPEELRRQIKISAVKRGISIAAWLIWAAENHLELCEKMEKEEKITHEK